MRQRSVNLPSCSVREQLGSIRAAVVGAQSGSGYEMARDREVANSMFPLADIALKAVTKFCGGCRNTVVNDDGSCNRQQEALGVVALVNSLAGNAPSENALPVVTHQSVPPTELT